MSDGEVGMGGVEPRSVGDEPAVPVPVRSVDVKQDSGLVGQPIVSDAARNGLFGFQDGVYEPPSNPDAPVDDGARWVKRGGGNGGRDAKRPADRAPQVKPAPYVGVTPTRVAPIVDPGLASLARGGNGGVAGVPRPAGPAVPQATAATRPVPAPAGPAAAPTMVMPPAGAPAPGLTLDKRATPPNGTFVGGLVRNHGKAIVCVVVIILAVACAWRAGDWIGSAATGNPKGMVCLRAIAKEDAIQCPDGSTAALYLDNHRTGRTNSRTAKFSSTTVGDKPLYTTGADGRDLLGTVRTGGHVLIDGVRYTVGEKYEGDSVKGGKPTLSAFRAGMRDHADAAIGVNAGTTFELWTLNVDTDAGTAD